MPKPNYAFEKRQRELEAKRKKAEKAARKSRPASESGGDGQAPSDGEDAPQPAAPATPD